MRSLFNAYRPTSSQISAPSKLPIVTSNVEELSRFIHGLVELNKTDLWACFEDDLEEDDLDDLLKTI